MKKLLKHWIKGKKYLFYLLFFFFTSAFAQPLNLKGCTWGGGQFVMVGEDSTIITSIDGINWKHQNTRTIESSLEGITWAYGNYIVVGSNNTILSSKDGIKWTAERSPLTGEVHLYDVEYLNGQFVAIGSQGTIITSKDGKNWEKQSSGTKETLRDVTWDQGVFYAVGNNSVIISSIDGRNWMLRDPGLKADRDQGVFYAPGVNSVITYSKDDKHLKLKDPSLKADFVGIINEATEYAKRNRYSSLILVGNTNEGSLVATTHNPKQMDWWIGHSKKNTKFELGHQRQLYDGVWDGKQTILVGQDIGVSWATSWRFLNASIDSVGPLQCIASNGKKQVAGGRDGILYSSYEEGSWDDRGMIWHGGSPIYSDDKTKNRFSIPMTKIKTDPVDEYGRLNTLKRQTLFFIMSQIGALVLIVYPLLQLYAILRMRKSWRFVSYIPLVVMIGLFFITFVGIKNESNLTFLPVVFVTPLTIGYLFILIVLHEAWKLIFNKKITKE